MAWSDASRAAAREARRMHAGYKKQFAGQTRFNIMASTAKDARNSLARAIKRMRAGTFAQPGYGEIAKHDVMSEAVASSRLRNLDRAKYRTRSGQQQYFNPYSGTWKNK